MPVRREQSSIITSWQSAHVPPPQTHRGHSQQKPHQQSSTPHTGPPWLVRHSFGNTEAIPANRWDTTEMCVKAQLTGRSSARKWQLHHTSIERGFVRGSALSTALPPPPHSHHFVSLCSDPPWVSGHKPPPPSVSLAVAPAGAKSHCFSLISSPPSFSSLSVTLVKAYQDTPHSEHCHSESI